MSFKELLEKYGSGTATDEERRMVEDELEKYDAINEFQYQRIEMMAEGEEEDEPRGGIEYMSEDGEQQFARRIRGEIRKAFIKTGIIVGACVIVIVLFIMLALPSMISMLYYDPGELAAGDEETGIGTNRMTLDIAVYTELMLPEARRNYVEVDDNKFGSYDIRISSDVWVGNEPYREISGKIVRDKLILYDTNVMRHMSPNEFGWFQRSSTDIPLTEQDQQEIAQLKAEMKAEASDEEDMGILHGSADRQSSSQIVEQLDDSGEYYSYVTLNEMMDYEDFYKFYTSHENLGRGWCAVKTSDVEEDGATFRSDNLGFEFYPVSSVMIDWDKEAYPDLFLWQSNDESWEAQRASSEELAKAHFTDLLDYMSRQDKFMEMMTPDWGYSFDLQQVKTYVEENGIKVYGFVSRADKETLRELLEEEEVYSIDVSYDK